MQLQSRPIGNSNLIPEEARFAALQSHATWWLNMQLCPRSHTQLKLQVSGPQLPPSTQHPQSTPTWQLRGTLSVFGKTWSSCNQSKLKIMTSPIRSRLSQPPQLSQDLDQCRTMAGCPFGVMSEVDSLTWSQVPICCRPYAGGSSTWVSSADAGTCWKVEQDISDLFGITWKVVVDLCISTPPYVD